MRFLMTLLLGLVTAGAAGLWYVRDRAARQQLETVSASAEELGKITSKSLERIEVGDVRLTRDGAVWNLDGGWPTRAAEANSYVALLSGIESRFAPIAFDKAEHFGFATDQKPVVIKTAVKLSAGGEKTYTLTFGKPGTDADNPFTRPTYLRIDDRNEVLRLAPALFEQIKKTRGDFLRRQLFPDVVRAKLGDAGGGGGELPPAAVALLDANALTVTGPDGTWTLQRTASEALKSVGGAPVAVNLDKLAGRWQLTAPVTDRADPDRLRGVLAAVPEMWAESFVTEADPQKTGLDMPERTVVVKQNDRTFTVHIGKVSRVKETKPPPPPPANPFSPPPPPPPVQREEYRYAKLPNNPQVFEVRTDRFADLFVKPGDLRDPRLARFKTADVKKIEVAGKDSKLIFVKEKDGADERWKITAPVTAGAEGAKVTELIEKLDQLQARNADVIDDKELKNYGLADADAPTTVTLTLNEEEPGDTPEAPKKATTRQVIYRVGKQDAAKSKLFMQVEGIARVDAVPDDLLKLIDRPVLAYRSRRVIDIPQKQLARITVERAADGFALTHANDKWSLAAPVPAQADAGKAGAIANDIARLDAAEFVNYAPTPEDLKTYGLEVPALKVVLATNDSSAAGKSLLIGKAREGKPEFYAKIDGAPEVFAVRQTVKDAVDQPSLALRPLQLWQAAGNQVEAIEVEQGGAKYTLSRDGAFWKISGPFSATAWLPAVQPFVEAASAPRAERVEAHADTEPAKYGLDKPEAVLRVTIKGEKADAPVQVKEIKLGKKVADGMPARFATSAEQPGVFVVGASITDVVAKTALDLLDRKLLAVDVKQINKLEGVGPAGPWSAKKHGDKWQIDSLTPPAAGDRAVLDGLVAAFADVRAQRFANYGTQDLAKFGLDKPAAIVTASYTAGDKPVAHTIALGKPSEDGSQARFARIDNGEAIAILPAGLSNELSRTALELVDRGVFKFDPMELIALKRTGVGPEMLLEKKDGAWQVVKPTSIAGDDTGLFELAERLSNLRAVNVAALAAKDLKPFGLDPPAATVVFTLKQATGSPRELTLKLGGRVEPDGRYGQAGSGAVYVIGDSANDPLAAKLLAPALRFRDRTLGKFTDADRVTITRGNRTATFAKVDGMWKMTVPLATDAEAFDLDDLVLVASKLRAEELLAEKAEDLKQFGLDKPQADVKFYLGDKEVYRLLIGNKEADGRLVVKPAAGDLVGKLEPGHSTRINAEFRKRAPWTNLDAAQVDSVVINAGAGGPPFLLNKGENGMWQVPGKPDDVVKPEAVSDLLTTLAALKVERYIVDQKADLKLHGLEPPVRIIAVRARQGQATTLHLGRLEGDSKRAYATIPGADWVAVLSEVDSAKLLRAVTEFVGK